VCIALGIPFFGIETARRRVFYLSCEDRESVLHWRLAHICSYLGVTRRAGPIMDCWVR
jgi:RecA-family ATPase